MPGALHVLPPVDRVTPVYVLAATSLHMLQGCRLLWQQDVAGPGRVEIPGSLGLPGRYTVVLATQLGVSLVGGGGQCVRCRQGASTIDRPCCPPPSMPTETVFCN
ncbi:MAG TPA: hypothetical protein PKU97_04720 [Kofleriaceae bacterium]|nr:hypothetical protein [Kofleriaceae bacterium]